jgi:hypothetical protein
VFDRPPTGSSSRARNDYFYPPLTPEEAIMKRQITKTKATKSSKTTSQLHDLPRDQARTQAEVDAKAHLIKGGAVTGINQGVKVAVDL